MGYIDFGGNMDICITIRTIIKKSGRVYVQAGGGIVAGSITDNEFTETVNKAGAALKPYRKPQRSSKMILIIDNYDSFTFNLYQYVGTLNSDVKVYRNDALSLKEIAELNPQRIILSPGPGYPKDAGVCEELLKELPGLCPILGVCLGHQAIGEVLEA